jgi:hypothetical protein
MDLIDKQDRRPALCLMLLCLSHCFPDVLNAAEYRRQGNELSSRVLSKHLRQRGLANPWWPPQQHRVQLPPFYRFTQGLSRG